MIPEDQGDRPPAGMSRRPSTNHRRRSAMTRLSAGARLSLLAPSALALPFQNDTLTPGILRGSRPSAVRRLRDAPRRQPSSSTASTSGSCRTTGRRWRCSGRRAGFPVSSCRPERHLRARRGSSDGQIRAGARRQRHGVHRHLTSRSTPCSRTRPMRSSARRPAASTAQRDYRTTSDRVTGACRRLDRRDRSRSARGDRYLRSPDERVPAAARADPALDRRRSTAARCSTRRTRRRSSAGSMRRRR